eukprot:448459-Prorocentrum_minimum.AAC.1
MRVRRRATHTARKHRRSTHGTSGAYGRHVRCDSHTFQVSLQPRRVSLQPGRVSLQPRRVSLKPGRVSLQPGR